MEAKPLPTSNPGRAAGDHIEQRRGHDRADDLRDDVRQDLAGRKAAAGGKADGHGRIEMAAGDMADRIGHGDDAQPERQRHADQADADLRKAGGDHRAAASRKCEPKRADRFGSIFLRIPCNASLCFRRSRNCKAPQTAPLMVPEICQTGLAWRYFAAFRGFPWPEIRASQVDIRGFV